MIFLASNYAKVSFFVTPTIFKILYLFSDGIQKSPRSEIKQNIAFSMLAYKMMRVCVGFPHFINIRSAKKHSRSN